MRGRGLKHSLPSSDIFRQSRPLCGAWIETGMDSTHKMTRNVAPYAGAWIETLLDGDDKVKSNVAPYAGAWIETPCPQ